MKSTLNKSGLQILKDFRHSKSGIAGIIILSALILMSLYSFLFVPLKLFREWNNPDSWINYPKNAAPAWTNTGIFGPKMPEHKILSINNAVVTDSTQDDLHLKKIAFTFDYMYDKFPKDFMITYTARYGQIQPLLQIDISRPDGKVFRLYEASLPSTQAGNHTLFSGRVFSTDRAISKNLQEYRNFGAYDPQAPEKMIFSDHEKMHVLKGKYTLIMSYYLFSDSDSVIDSGFILGGQVYGLMGTDELRRDLAIGILWGAPVALFIGLTVSIAAIFIGLLYGIFAGYKGGRIDEGLMRINDIFYTLPQLPILVILSVTIGRNIFLITGFLIIFGWVGTAKISRSLALQIKNLQYVEASKLLGQSDFKIIFKHIIPQLLPLTLASIAIAVPAAILGEAALSFIGLGDPTIPTWGQILHDANSAGAASRGLWWWVIPPGLMIAITGLAFVLIGNTMDTLANPRSRFKKS